MKQKLNKKYFKKTQENLTKQINKKNNNNSKNFKILII